jgi:diguanylate cyclase (GGDEF)-like protein
MVRDLGNRRASIVQHARTRDCARTVVRRAHGLRFLVAIAARAVRCRDANAATGASRQTSASPTAAWSLLFPRMENVSVLLIADESETRQRVATALRTAVANGLMLVDAGASRRALERAWLEPFSCVLVDASVLAREGLPWLDDLVKAPHAPAVLVLTAEARGEHALRALEHGAQEYLTLSECAQLPHAIDRALARQGRIRTLREANRVLALSLLDPLTRVLHRGALELLLPDTLLQCQRRDSTVTGLLVDCDGLRHVNETKGHAAGDEVLAEIARRIRGLARSNDQIARVRGDEFLLVLPDTSQAQALAFAERVRNAISGRPITAVGITITVTASLGVFPVRWSATVDDLCSLGDVAVHESKARGRNCVSATWTGAETATWPPSRSPLQLVRPATAPQTASHWF